MIVKVAGFRAFPNETSTGLPGSRKHKKQTHCLWCGTEHTSFRCVTLLFDYVVRITCTKVTTVRLTTRVTRCSVSENRHEKTTRFSPLLMTRWQKWISVVFWFVFFFLSMTKNNRSELTFPPNTLISYSYYPFHFLNNLDIFKQFVAIRIFEFTSYYLISCGKTYLFFFFLFWKF